jgi:hypothetical protein
MTALHWRTRADAGTATEPEAGDAPVWPVLAELEVYTRTRRLLGWIAPEGERTSDWMNRGHELELLSPMELTATEARPVVTEPSGSLRRVRVLAQDVLLAVPPNLPTGRHLRLHRRILRIHFEMDAYDVRGRIHVRPGAEVGDYLLRSSRVFVPITDAEVVHRVDPVFSRSLPVLIVNSRHVSRLHLVEGSAPAPHDPRLAEDLVAPVLDVESESGETTDAEASGDVYKALSQLTALHRDGLVTDQEFQEKRAEILARL